MTAPLVSVVIPTFERPASIRACLRGLAELEFERARFEVIVVDDGGSTSLAEVLDDFSGRLCVRLVRQDRGGPGPARNAGAAVARGRYLAFIDDDCVPAPSWLTALVRALEADPSRLVGGRVENALSRNPYADASDRISRFVYEYYRLDGAKERFFTTNNIGLATERFRALGGFTSEIPSATAEDKEFCDRWRAHGLELAHAPDAVVYHAHDLTFTRFLRQHFNYGRGILTFRLMRRARLRAPLVPEPAHFYAGLVTSPMRSNGHPPDVRASLLIVAAQLATMGGALYQTLQRTGPRAADRG